MDASGATSWPRNGASAPLRVTAGSVVALHCPRGALALAYKLALRDLPEMFLIRCIVFSHEAVRDRG